MKSYGQIGYEAYCEELHWLQGRPIFWLKLGATARDAWEAAGDAVEAAVKDVYESKIEELEEKLKSKNG